MTEKNDGSHSFSAASPHPNASSQRVRRSPAAFRLDDKQVRISDHWEKTRGDETKITPQPPGDNEDEAPTIIKKRQIRWSRYIAAGFGGLASLAIGLSIDALIRDLFTRADWLGWIAVALAALTALGVTGLIAREILGLARLGKIEHIRRNLDEAAREDDAPKARANLSQLIALYANRPETARGRSRLSQHMEEVIDGRDLIILCEKDLLTPLDRQANTIVMESARRVSVVTAISPRALVDLLVVLFENLRIIRRLSLLYGGRPGVLGFLRLARHVLTHLTITGGMAAGDSLISQVLGHGLAARVSARLGEGVVNGVLTARIGIAAIDVCRPAPFVNTRGPKIGSFISELAKLSSNEETKKGKTASNSN